MTNKSKTKIEKRSIDKLRADAQAAKRTLYLWDSQTSGFGALATKTGSCSYFVEYRPRGSKAGTSSKRMTIGKHGVHTPEQARSIAKAELGKVANNIDVVQVEKDRRKQLAADTFKDMAEKFLTIKDRKSRYWAETRRLVEQKAYPALGSKPMTTITRAQVADVIDDVEARSASTARLLFAALRPMFAWAVERSIIEQSPMIGLGAPKPPKARDRILSDDEIKAFWTAVSELSGPYEKVFKLLLLTGARREEVAGMRWREVDLDNATWTVAKERTKNGKAHTVDLHQYAIRILISTAEATPALDLVFPTTNGTPVSGFSQIKRRVDQRMKEILEDAGHTFEPWRTHDLRRTAASGMAALGFQPQVIERVLNHLSGAQGGLVGVYQRFEYRQERNLAVLAWGDHVAGLVGERVTASNVVSLHKAVA